MKKLMIILLIGMLSLGLSGIAFAASEQAISAKITSTLTLTVPTALSGWILAPGTSAEAGGTNTTFDNTTPTAVSPFAAKVETNSPYTLSVEASASLPSYENTADVYMTTSYDSTEVDLATNFQLKWNSTGSAGATATTADHFSSLGNVTITTAETFVTATSPPLDGTAYVGIEFGQTTVATDPAYDDVEGQLNYQIQLTWTASATLT